MVCTANDILVWKDFPKGLRVLLLDEDSDSASELRSKLEKIDYIVSTFLDENEALLAVSNRLENFHIAIVEVNTSNSDGIFRFLEAAKELPTIMTSRMHCLNTIMKSIALGAAEFLQKPISNDKLRNIWQHVVHKAFNAKGSVISDSLKPVKESVISILQFSSEKGETNNHIPREVEIESRVHENGHDQAVGSEKYSAPSTPQLNQVPSSRLLFDGDSHCQDQANSSSEVECGEQFGKCKSVETTSRDDSVAEVTTKENVVKEESDSGDASKSENDIPLCQQNKDDASNIYCESENSSKASGLQKLRGCKSNRKKMKIGWTPELHKQFVHAVEQLGVDHAIPSRILELMKVEGLTRHNVASHLQKYRMHQRHILPKQNGRWVPPRDLIPTAYYPHNPVIAYPPYHPFSPHAFPAGLFFPVWGQPCSSQLPGLHVWGSPGYSAPNWHWNPYSLNPSGFYNGGCGGIDNGCAVPQCSAFHPAADALDKAVSEAISKPWLPLPLGLNPPSTDTVLTELSKQGISAMPPRIMDGSGHC